MANFKGRDFVLKLGNWAGGTTIADCRTHSLRVNNEMVDITNKSSNGYRTLLEGAGVQSITVSLGGVMTDTAGFETFQGFAFAGSINAMALGWADGDTLACSFMVTSFEVTGEYNGEQQFTATLESSGQWTFTAA